MKPYLKFKIGILLITSFLLTSCYDLQESFDFQPDVDLTDPHDQKTAWEFIQERTALTEETETRPGGEISFEELNFMIEAIKVAGFEDLYNQTETTDRTYLLLNNAAFLVDGNIIDIVLQDEADEIEEGETPEQIMARVDTPKELETLRTILRYHIVDAYIDQVPTLFETEVRYVFQTLIPGDDGFIVFSRNSRWTIQINTPPAPLPETATQEPENVRRHNYVFNNGIGHFIHDPVRNKPYN